MKTDLIIKNGKFLSYDLNGNKTAYEAVAVYDGRITALGSDIEIMELKTDNTKEIDAKGNTVLPGFCDAHVHASFTTEMACGASVEVAVVEEGESREEYIARSMEGVRAYAEAHPEKEVIRAMGWNPAAFQMDPNGMPTCEELDKIYADRPVLVTSYCHHYIWINTKALQLTGIDKNTELPYGCIVYKDDEGNPTGLFQEFPAIEMVLKSFRMADYPVEEYEQGIIEYQEKYAFPNGIVSCFDPIVRPNAMKAYQNLVKNNKLKLRVSGAMLADPTLPVSQFDEIISSKGKYDIGSNFKIDTIKFFFDGSGLEFYLNEPFTKEILDVNGLPSDFKGNYIWPLDKAKEAFLIVSKAGFNIHVHAMGDGAVKEAIDAFEYVAEQGVSGLKHVITHVMLIDDSDIERMNKLGIIAAMQPQWGQYDYFAENYMVPLLGRERTERCYPAGQLIKNGVLCSFATDFPVVQYYDTFQELQTGITRKPAKSSPEYGMYDNIPVPYKATLDEMLETLTIAGAYQISFDDITGSFEVGKSADFVILDQNIETINIEEIENIKIDRMIVMGGETC